jgi:pimeloyl-ACP methyl ester carboxylesterase
MGGMVALHAAIRHPSRVRSLLLACTPAEVDPGIVLARAAAVEAHGMAPIVESTLTRWFTRAFRVGGHEEPDTVRYARETLTNTDPQLFAAGWRAIAKHDVVRSLSRIRVPVTCVAGRQDVSTTEDVVRQLYSGLPFARMDIVPGPHMLHLERPQQFSTIIRTHLTWAHEHSPPGHHAGPS